MERIFSDYGACIISHVETRNAHARKWVFWTMHRNEAQTKYHFCGFIFDTLSIYLIVFTNRTIKILLSIKLCNVTSHVTIIGNRLLPAGWNLCLVVKFSF